MRSKHILLVGVLVVAVLLAPAMAEAVLGQFISPQLNRTYPYTANHVMQLNSAGMPIGVTNCSYRVTWLGENSTHPDYWLLPVFTYDRVFLTCTQITDGTHRFDLDFDGKYNITAVGWVEADKHESSVEFYVDRNEMEQSRPLTAVLLVLGILAIAWFFHFIANSLDEEHAALKLYLLLVQIFVAALSVFSLESIHREYLKTNMLNTTMNTMIYVFLMGIITVTIVYFVIYLFKKLAEKMHWKDFRKPRRFA